MTGHPTIDIQPGARPGNRVGRFVLPVAGLVLAGLVVHGVLQRRDAEAKLARWTDERALPSVAVLSPHYDASPKSFTLPGDVQAFYDAEIHAQVSGYIKVWNKDIGAVAKKGDVLAVIDTPELDESIAQAEQEVTRAKATQAMAEVTAQRWGALRSSAAVSQQASDEKDSDTKVKRADVGAAEARIARLKAQKAFANVVAPFDGVVTARNIDIGAFVTPTGGGAPLFKVADIHAVRVYVSAPQSYAGRLKPGMEAKMTLAQHPGQEFLAKIATTANAIAEKSRTLLVELLASNPGGALLPGAYANVRFELPHEDKRLRVPSSALAFGRKGMTVATLDDHDRVHFRTIAIGSDFGSEVEVESGLSPQDRIIDNPMDTLGDGDEVRVSAPPAQGRNAGARSDHVSAQ